MSYEMPKIKTLTMKDLLSQLGPARALIYVPGGGNGDDELPDF